MLNFNTGSILQNSVVWFTSGGTLSSQQQQLDVQLRYSAKSGKLNLKQEVALAGAMTCGRRIM